MNLRQLMGTGEWTTRRYLSLLGNILIWIIVAIDAWYLWPTQLGGDTSVVIVSGSSMEPTYYGGDLVIARKMAPSIGDVIVYSPEGLGGSQIVHRIIGGSAEEGWQMQGDNNDFIDPFTPKGDEVRGVVLVHYSNFGRVTAFLLNPMVWAFVLLAALVLLLWWSDDCDDDDERDGSDSADEDRERDLEDEQEPDLIDRVVEGTEAAVARMVSASGAALRAVFGALTRPSQAPRHAAHAPQHAVSSPRRPAIAFLRVGTVLALVGVVSVLGVAPASASQLHVAAQGQVSVLTDQKCATQNLVIVPTGSSNGNQYSQVTISGISPDCAGLPLSVTIHRANHQVLSTGATTAAAGSVPVAVSSFNATQAGRAFVKIDGWIFPAAWTPPSDTYPLAGQCNGLVTSTGLILDVPCSLSINTTRQYGGTVWVLFPWYYINVQAATTFTPDGYLDSNNQWVNYQGITRWRYTIDLATMPSVGWPSSLSSGFYIYKNGNNTRLAPNEDCSDPSSITLEEDVLGTNPSSNLIVSPYPLSWATLMCSG